MSSILYSKNELNVQYISDFIEKSHADRIFAELKSMPFYTPTLRIRGRKVKPKRPMLAFGDRRTYYSFSGASIPAVAWCPLMIELRHKGEKLTASTFN